jgi:hypothetical protein
MSGPSRTAIRPTGPLFVCSASSCPSCSSWCDPDRRCEGQGPDEHDRRRRAAVVSLTEARRHPRRVVKPLPRRVSPGEMDQGFRTDSAACLPKPGSIPDAPCASWVRGSRGAPRASVPL